MILNPTKYKNPERTIVGLLNFVANGDTIILCDTSTGAVALELLSIPNDQWSTTYALYVIDKSNNASVNNITINAPSGFKINNQSSLTINTNGGSVVIRVASSTSYLGSLTSGGTSGGSISVVNKQNPLAPANTLTTNLTKLTFSGFQSTNIGNEVTVFNAFVSVTYAQLVFLIGNNNLTKNQWYNVTNATYGNQGNTVNIFLIATDTNKVNPLGYGQFFNADYGKIGNYSGIPTFNSQLGVWNNTLTPILGDVVIWDNLMWLNTTGANIGVPPPADGINYQQLSFNVTNGYILVSDIIQYFYDANFILYRKDKYLNEVSYGETSGLSKTISSLDSFRWGDPNVLLNIVQQDSVFICCNSEFKPTDFIVKNNLVNTTLIFGDPDNNFGGTNANFIGNIFENNLANIFYGKNSGNGTFKGNTISKSLLNPSGFVIENVGLYEANEFYQCVGIIRNEDGASEIRSTTFINCLLDIFNFGKIQFNQFTKSTLNITNQLNSRFNDNLIVSCEMSIVNSGADIFTNKFSYSIIVIETNFEILNNEIDYSNFTLQNNSNAFGGFVSVPIGNKISNSLVTILANNSLIQNNTITDSTLLINNNQATIGGNLFAQNSNIRIDINSGQLIRLITYKAVFGTLLLSNNRSFNGGVYSVGNLSIAVELDCSNPVIFDSGLNKLTIPPELKEFAGIFILNNASGITIEYIVDLNNIGEQTFYSNGGSVTIKTQAVGFAGNGIISSRVPPYSFVLVYRANGNDFIKIIRNVNINCVSNSNAGIFL